LNDAINVASELEKRGSGVGLASFMYGAVKEIKIISKH